MTQKEQSEVHGMINEILSSWNRETVLRETLIHQSLNNIDKHLEKLNGSVATNIKDIQQLKINEVEHVINCPVMPKVEKISEDLEEYHFIKKYPKILLVVIAILVLGLIISATGTIQSWTNSTRGKQIKQSVDGIRYELAPTRSVHYNAVKDTIK